MASNKLYRSFIILQEDERGHSVSNDKPLSGYTKIEAKGEKCKIAFYAQNLKSANEKCHMAVVCNKKDGNYILDLGLMNIDSQGKVEASLEYSTNNIGNLDVSYDKIIGAVIYKEVSGKVVFMMCGFLNGQQPKENWKAYKIIYNKIASKKLIKNSQNDDKKNEDKHKKNTTSNEQIEENKNTRSNVEDIAVKQIDNSVVENLNEVSKEVNVFDEYEASIEARINGGNYEKEADENYSEQEIKRVVKEIKLQAAVPEFNQDQAVEDTVQTKGTFGAQKVQSSTGTVTVGDEQSPTDTVSGQMQGTTGMTSGQVQGATGMTSAQTQGVTGMTSGQMQPMGTTGTVTGQVQSSATMGEKKYQQTGVMHGGYKTWNDMKNVNDKQGFRNNNDPKDNTDIELTGATGEFFSSVVNDFEYTEGFAKEIKNCKWYKVKVDDFDVLCNMSNYNKYTVAYYPMISYYPYISKRGYFMIGFKHDENGVVKYVTYAIPGYKDKNHQPYGGKTGFVTWCPEFKNSDNGHWIMFYDFQTCRVLIPVNK